MGVIKDATQVEQFEKKNGQTNVKCVKLMNQNVFFELHQNLLYLYHIQLEYALNKYHLIDL